MTNEVDPSKRIRLTNRFVEIDGVPTIPVSGEIHYSRIPRRQWEERLRLMKAGGITVVATYVIWIHHEEHRGQPRFDGNLDVAAFVDLCERIGLDVVLRIGPWCHGEVRNGGFPDWVEASGADNRTDDPAYLDLVKTWFAHLGKQLADRCVTNGPVIGIQLENELYDQPGHIRTLKRLAREAGLTAPVWTATAWGGADLPEGEVLPLFGGYGDGFWVDAGDEWDATFRAHYFFSRSWDDPGIGADLRDSAVGTASGTGSEALIGTLFPPATCEIGGGMATAYHRRPRPSALDIAAVSHTKIGNGSAWQGYYMFAGGTNPAGELGMQESHATGYPNDLPRFDYDFAAPISAAGTLAESFAALRSQHAFLAAFGGTLATMPSSLPDRLPTGIDDTTTVRWALRSDGGSGFVFLGWHQPHVPLPTAPAVQFRVELADQVVEFPAEPVDIPAGTLARWPVRLPIGGVRMTWATASVLTVLDGERPTLVLTAEHGIPVDLALDGDAQVALAASSNAALERREGFWRLSFGDEPAAVLSIDDALDIVVLPATRATDAWALDTRNGRELVLSADPLWVEDDGTLAARASGTPDVRRYVPAERAFASVPLGGESGSTTDLAVTRVAVAGPIPSGYGSRSGRESAPGDDPALTSVYAVAPPAGGSAGGNVVLDIGWEGDVARLAVDGTVVADRFWDGSDWRVAIDGVSPDAEVTVSIIPLSPESTIHLPADAERRRRLVDGPLGALTRVRHVESAVWREATG